MLLDVKNLDISYGSKLTVAGVNIQLDKGEILSIVGESGSGKTTVIRAIMGCLPGRGHVSGGSITFDGRDMLKNTREDWRKISGNEMSMIFPGQRQHDKPHPPHRRAVYRLHSCSRSAEIEGGSRGNGERYA